MGRVRRLVQTSVGAKMVMGLTGLTLFLFVRILEVKLSFDV